MTWLKATIVIGLKSKVIVSVDISDGYSHEANLLEPLLNDIDEDFNIESVVGDKAYSSRKNIDKVYEIGAIPYFPFKKNANAKSKGGRYWNRAYRFYKYNREEFDDVYRFRVNVEATFSSIKRSIGEKLKSKDRVAQENELLCKILAYNITVMNKYNIL